MYKRRLSICLAGGAISAVICIIGRQLFFGNPPITWDTVAYTMINRLLLGFVIAVSGWKIKHLSHGAIIGFVVSFSVSLGFLFSDPFRCLIYTAAGVAYGMLIEWASTDLFKAPMKTG